MKPSTTSKSFLALLAAGAFGAVSANAATILTENFESGASGWNLNASPGTSSTSIASVDLGLGDGASNLLRIATGSFYQIAETPTLNLTDATFATIVFDYGDTNGGGTRFMSVDLWDGATWRDVSGNISHNTVNGELSYTVTTVAWFGSNNKFRFEGKNGGGGGTHYSYIDNVVITSDAIPEPSTALLGGLGLLALLRRRRA